MNYESTSSHKLNEMSFREAAYRYRRFYVHKPAWGAAVPASRRSTSSYSQRRYFI